jgi:hypothetical protein
MLTIPEWWLVVVLASNTTGLVPVQRFMTQEACESQKGVEVIHMTVTGRQVVSARCQHVRVRPPRATGGEIVVR